MKIDLPDGNWVEMRDVDDLRTGDKLAVRRAMKIPRNADGTTDVTAAFTDEMRIAMLGRIITEWSYEGWPIPSLALSANGAIEQLPISAYDALSDAVKPYLDAIDYSPSE